MSRGRAGPLFDLCVWKGVTIALAINAVSVLVIVISLFLFGFAKEPLSDVVNEFGTEKTIWQSGGKVSKRPPHSLTIPIKDLFNFRMPHQSRFIEIFVKDVFSEEFVYRGPIVIAVSLLLFFKVRNRYWPALFLWSAGLCLNFYWAYGHSEYHRLWWIPVFTAGIPWLWLVIRTNRLWPSMVCHGIANLSIYFLVKVYQLLH